MTTIIRMILAVIFLYGVYTETGIFTTTILFLLWAFMEARIYSNKQEDFQMEVMKAVVELQPNAYGVSIAEYLEKQNGKRVSTGSIYVALQKLKEDGFVESWSVEGGPESNGLPKLYFKIKV